MEIYRDPVTGYEIRRYTNGPERNAKLYFTCENFSTDDKYFFFMKQQMADAGKELSGGCYRADVETGELERVTDYSFRGFATDREKNIGYTCKNETEVYAVDLSTMEMTKIGDLPKGGQITGHLTASDSGRIACSYHLANKYYGLVIMDPGKEAEVVYQSDYRLGHAQICPTDENLIFYIHETEGDAFQPRFLRRPEIDAALGEALGQLFHQRLAPRAGQIHLGHEHKGRHPGALQQPPERLGMGLHAVGAADDQHGIVHDLQRSFRLGREVRVPRRVQQGQLPAAPAHAGLGREDRDAPLALQRVEVQGRIPVVHPPEAPQGPAAVEDGFCQGGFARVHVGQQAETGGVCRFVHSLSFQSEIVK